MAPRIALFDLDGTVLTFQGPAPGPGRTSLERTMMELYALEGAADGMRLAGGTDRALVRAMLRRAGVTDDDAAITRVLDRYAVHLETVLRTRRYLPIGPVAGAVERLRTRGVVVGVATGNTRQGAHLKLVSAGLADAFDLTCGAYGCDAEARAEIVRLAAARCGARESGADVVVVGDTEHDVRAARAIGARVVGVAIDAAARDELLAAGADAIVERCDERMVDAVIG